MNININIDLETLIQEETEILQNAVEAKLKRLVIKYARIINKDDLDKSSEIFFKYILEDIKRFLINNKYVNEFEYCVEHIHAWYLHRLNMYFKIQNPRLSLVDILKYDAEPISMKIIGSSLYAANHDKLTDKIYENKKKEYMGE